MCPEFITEADNPLEDRELISVIIPTFNEVKRIGRCISRVRQAAETEGPLEIIVVDGGKNVGTTL